MKKNPLSENCPRCKENVQQTATKCPHCHEDFTISGSGVMGQVEHVGDKIFGFLWFWIKIIAVFLITFWFVSNW